MNSPCVVLVLLDLTNQGPCFLFALGNLRENSVKIVGNLINSKYYLMYFD